MPVGSSPLQLPSWEQKPQQKPPNAGYLVEIWIHDDVVAFGQQTISPSTRNRGVAETVAGSVVVDLSGAGGTKCDAGVKEQRTGGFGKQESSRRSTKAHSAPKVRLP